MARVATIPLQRTMTNAISRAQEKLAVTQQQLNSGKKAADFAALGTETVRNLSAHSLLARQDAHTAVSKRVGTTLSLYQGHIEGIQDASEDLRKQILTAVGTGDAAGLQEAIQTAFDQFRTSMNGSEGGTPLFGGSQVDGNPFTANTLADVAATPTANAFRNDNVRSTARISDGVDVSYGIGASELGSGLYEAFRTLAAAGPISEKPDATQMLALQDAVGKLDSGLAQLRGVNAENGRKQAQVETLTERGANRALLLKGVIESNEDADLGQVATDLATQKTVLQASYSVFSQLSELSLVNYIR